MNITKLGKWYYSHFTEDRYETNTKKYLSSAYAGVNFVQWPLENTALSQGSRRAFNGNVQTTSSGGRNQRFAPK